MRYSFSRGCLFVGLLLLTFATSNTAAQNIWPAEFGSTVTGYQDDFGGDSLSPNWMPIGASGQEIYAVSGGVLHVSTAGGDPNHLAYALPGYDDTTQEVLARIRFKNFGTGDPARGGIGVGIDPGNGHAINFHFRDLGSRHMAFLDDLRAWGPQLDFAWQNDVWYWVRLRQQPNAALGSVDVFARIWAADGSVPEPTEWHTWDYIPARSPRAGFAGITAGSSSGISEFEVDYILIKAQGLPAITAAAEAFPLFTPGAGTFKTQPQSQSVTECEPVTFRVTIDGTPPYQLQWSRNGTAILNATNESLTLPSPHPADDGAAYRVQLRNSYNGVTYAANSAEAVLSVMPDVHPPRLRDVVPVGLDRVTVRFTEAITLASATNLPNYRITNQNGAVEIVSAGLESDQASVVLTTRGAQEGAEHTLLVRQIVDQCTGLNNVWDWTRASFFPRDYSFANIGVPSTGAASVRTVDGYDITGFGLGLEGTSDQFHFTYRRRTGDFDVQVRVENFAAGSSWAEAGLVARDSTIDVTRSPFAGVFATPSAAGSFFKSRDATLNAPVQTGSFPVNYPYTWLRLKRVGNQLTGYASVDGVAWTQLGSRSIPLQPTVMLGFAVASNDQVKSATAAFRDFADVSNATTTPNINPLREPLSQSSRKTGLVISEIMYHPSRSFAGARSLEFIELFNTLDTPEDMSGYELEGDIEYTFPQGTVISGGGFLVVAEVPSDVQNAYGISGVLGPWRNNLPNDNGQVQLRSHAGAVFLEVNYNTAAPWPVSPDGAGPSLVLARPSLGEDDAAAWAASDTIGGSPGRIDPVAPNPLRSVMLNEFLAHTDEPELDFIELYNHSEQEIDLSGAFLSDDPETNKFVIPGSTKIPAREFVTFDQAQLGFSLEANGETIFFRSPDNRVVDAIRFGGQANGVSFGRSPDGAPDLRALSSETRGEKNSTFALPPVVINEIMYNPISGPEQDEYVELYNRTPSPIDLSGWTFIDGIEFTFPSNTVLQANGYFVVAANASRFRTNYSNLNDSNLAGNFTGNLSNNGERIALAKPDTQIAPNSLGQLTTNIIHILVNEVTYDVGGAWGQWSDAGGSSVELVNPDSDNSLAANWADSDESAKGAWKTVSTTGRLDHGNVSADQLQVLLQGAGACLIDDVQVLNANNQNLIANSTFESNANGWTAEGTESASGLETSQGFNSARSYHVRAVRRGDNQVNRIRTPLTTPLAPNSTATIRAKVRWLRGYPELLFRLRGNWLEAVCAMNIPTNLGSPGARNSRFAANTAPAIFDVTHAPILPAAGEAVLVSARVQDPNGLSAVALRYRIDPSTTAASVPMRDDGTGGDEHSGDGIFSGTIPGQTAGSLVAFHVQATDQASTPVSATFPKDAPGRECLVRFGETQPAGSFPVYRVWMTQATLNTWNTRHKLNNTPLPVTFVLGNHRVIYGAEALYAGSPYIAPGYSGPTSGRCGYSLSFPEDDLFLGANDLVLDWPGGHGGETTAIQEQMAYYIADRMRLPYSHRYFIRLHVNGVTDDDRRSIFEAVHQPDAEFVNAWSPGDDDGDFYKIDRAFEFSDNGGTMADPMPTLEDFTTVGGVKKTARYRWNWLKRASDDANNYTNIFNLVDALNSPGPEPYTSTTESLVDIEEWMGIFAAEHIINNFDSWGHIIGKNMYAYKPENGRWQLYMFDLDWLMIVANGWYTANNGPLFESHDPVVARMYEHPPFRRAYFRAVLDAVNGPLLAANANPVMDAKYNSLLANAVRYCDGQSLTSPSALKNWFVQRRNYLLGQLATVAATFRVSTPTVVQTATSPVTISGTAPIPVESIQVNGIDWPATWTTISNWTVRVPLTQRTNVLTLLGVDNQGALVPGTSNVVTVNFSGPLAPQATIAINEWMASNTKTLSDSSSGTARYDDWFELYNYGTNIVNLAGLFLTDKLNEKSQFEIPPGYSIPPGGYLLVWADDDADQNRSTDSALHVNFQLSVGGEVIGLFASDGTEIDTVTFGPQTNDVSEGRCPAGGDAIAALRTATPGAANDCAPAQPPMFEPVVVSGNQLTLRWAPESGRSYQIEYTDDLNLLQWLPLGDPVTGANSFLTVDLSAAPQRYFRLRRL